jgi:hypothetical protein
MVALDDTFNSMFLPSKSSMQDGVLNEIPCDDTGFGNGVNKMLANSRKLQEEMESQVAQIRLNGG